MPTNFHHVGLVAADRARAVKGVEYGLRLVRVYQKLVGGDPTRALVFLAATNAASRNLDGEMIHARLDEEGYLIPEFRKPISISALARSLDLPFETTRRHVIALCEDDFLQRMPDGGVTSTKGQLSKPRVQAAVRNNLAYLDRLLRLG